MMIDYKMNDVNWEGGKDIKNKKQRRPHVGRAYKLHRNIYLEWDAY